MKKNSGAVWDGPFITVGVGFNLSMSWVSESLKLWKPLFFQICGIPSTIWISQIGPPIIANLHSHFHSALSYPTQLANSAGVTLWQFLTVYIRRLILTNFCQRSFIRVTCLGWVINFTLLATPSPLLQLLPHLRGVCPPHPPHHLQLHAWACWLNTKYVSTYWSKYGSGTSTKILRW